MTNYNSAMTATVIIAAIAATGAFAPANAQVRKAPAQVSYKTATPKVAIGLRTNKVSRSSLAGKIRRQALVKGVKLSSREVSHAVNAGMNKLASAGNGPLKGIIHIKLKRITICIDWGKDQGHCG
jgi:hypothetical protein